MDIYARKSRWKIYLALLGIAIVVGSMMYTKYLADNLAKEERVKAKNWANAMVFLDEMDDEDFANCDITLYHEIIQSNKTIPVIWMSETGTINEGINFGEEQNTDTTFLRKEVNKLIAAGEEPIDTYGGYLYYKESRILTLLQYLPLVQFVLIAVFITFGYLGFSSSRRAEQNRVWAGMAKETAHQLGTPISAILGWIEHLKAIRPDDEEVLDVATELNNDVMRLDLVADRFSKIGSEPKLKKVNIFDELEGCRSYMQRRAPRKVEFDFPGIDHSPLYVNINPHLFDWVIENLLRNALDSMDGTGKISATVYAEKGNVIIDITDTGKGIQSSKFKTIFQPGFTTKQRGWGLGLSLAKRIIENYHSGKIFVRKSVINDGTTFTVKLPQEV
jgi:two-component system, sporulation sensor kinase D